MSGELGEVDVTWQNITGAVQIPASVRPLRGREFFDSLQLQTEMSHVVRVRYIPGVTAKCRVLYDSRVLSIVAPPMDVDEEHRVLELACAEGVRDA